MLKTYLVLGDSITWTIDEVPAPRNSLYSSRVKGALEALGKPIQVVNKGFGGAISTDIVDCLGWMALGLPYDLVTIGVGMNDCSTSILTDLTLFETNLNTIIDRLRYYRPNCEIILCQISPTNKANRIENIANYRAKISAVATAKNVLLADFSNAYSDFATYTSDGIHPKAAGHALLFNILWPVIETTDFYTKA